MTVYFHSEDIVFNLKDAETIKSWIHLIIEKYHFSAGDINIIFTSNQYLLNINKAYLKHSYFTDVITFNYNSDEVISGDIFISIDQVKLNAKDYDAIFEDELNRVIIHGILHLIGFNDNTESEIADMRREEEEALIIFQRLSDERNL